MKVAFLLLMLPALAAAQFIPKTSGGGGGGGGGEACTLDGTTAVFASYFRATATSGTGYQCDALLASCIDLGPGARNYIGTNAAGDILLGPDSGTATVVRIFGTAYAAGFATTNGIFDATLNTYIGNTWPGEPLKVDDAEGLKLVGRTTLATCSASLRGTLQSFLFAAGSGTADRLCWCRSDNAASPTYRWVNAMSGNVGTTATECPL
jgi:hypothetical protein